MNSFFKNLFYILEHKKNVFIEGRKLKIGFRQLLKHDNSKLTRAEFKHYQRKFFYKKCFDCINYRIEDKTCHKTNKKTNNFCNYFKRDENHPIEINFKKAWLHHQKKNKHHWQYWLKRVNEELVPSEMPLNYIKEMLADWNAMSRKFQDKNNIRESSKQFFLKSKNTKLHSKTYNLVMKYFETGEI